MIDELRWDDWNVEHIARHHVEYWEVEEVLQNQPLFIRVRSSRLQMIGQTEAGRYLAAFADHQGYGGYYVVSARDATRSERRRFGMTRGN